MANSQRSFEENDFCGSHIYKCGVCTKWLRWFRLYQEMKEEEKEGDISAFDKPIIGANPFEISTGKEETYEEMIKRKGLTDDFKRSTDEPLEDDLDRKDFDSSLNEFIKKKKKQTEKREN